VGLVSVAVGCSLVAGYDGVRFDRQDGSSAAGGEAGATGGMGAMGGTGATGGGGEAGGCGSCDHDLEECYNKLKICVAKSVVLGNYNNNPWSIDITEVTNKQYEDWLGKGPKTEDQNNANCIQKNNEFDNSCDNITPNKNPNHPVTCIDWCDAVAYCEAVGKRLCGKISGSETSWLGVNNVAESQWFAACTSGDPSKYTLPCGEGHHNCNCNLHTTDTREAARNNECASSSGVFDLIGNAAEWEACCTVVSDRVCRIRGGSYDSDDVPSVSCAHEDQMPYMTRSPNIGFRCCKGPNYPIENP